MSGVAVSLRRRLAVGAAYGLAGALLMVAAIPLRGWAGWLLWPAVSCVLMSASYATASTRLFGRTDGRLSPLVRLVMAPVLLAVKGNICLWTWRQVPAFEVSPGIWLGRSLTLREQRRFGFGSVVNLAAECDPPIGGANCRTIPVLDLLAPTTAQIVQALEAIEHLRRARPTLVCCALGYSRSASVMAAWLMTQGLAPTVEQAITALHSGSRRVVITAAHLAALRCWDKERRCV